MSNSSTIPQHESSRAPPAQLQLVLDEPGRYRLYTAMCCPFAHRVQLVRLLLGLEASIHLSYAVGHTVPEGFIFDQAEPEFGAMSIQEVYTAAAAAAAATCDDDDGASTRQYTGKPTVPLLIDRTTKTIASNESLDLVVALIQAAGASSTMMSEGSLELARDISEHITVAVYKCLAAARDPPLQADLQSKLLQQLDYYEDVLSNQRFVMGNDSFTIADCVLFPSLIRFDNVYARQFGLLAGTNVTRLRDDYPALTAYMHRIWQMTPTTTTTTASTPTTTGGGSSSSKTVGDAVNLPELIRIYWQSAKLALFAGNDPQSPVPDVLPLF